MNPQEKLKRLDEIGEIQKTSEKTKTDLIEEIDKYYVQIQGLSKIKSKSRDKEFERLKAKYDLATGRYGEIQRTLRDVEKEFIQLLLDPNVYKLYKSRIPGYGEGDKFY